MVFISQTSINQSNSERILFKAPISFHVTSGIVANPSRFEDGWTLDTAVKKSALPIDTLDISSELAAILDEFSHTSTKNCKRIRQGICYIIPLSNSIFIALISGFLKVAFLSFDDGLATVSYML